MSADRSSTRRPRRAPVAEERQRDAERSRQQLLAAALDEFSAKGFSGARVQKIAARAGVNAQLITYYFGGKEGLYRALQQRWLEREASFAHPELSLEELVLEYARDALSDPRAARLLLWAGLGDGAPTQAESSLQANAEADIAEIRRRQTLGELPPDLDPAMLQLALIGVILAPISIPQVARRLTGLDPAAPEFGKAFTEQLERLLQHLAA